MAILFVNIRLMGPQSGHAERACYATTVNEAPGSSGKYDFPFLLLTFPLNSEVSTCPFYF